MDGACCVCYDPSHSFTSTKNVTRGEMRRIGRICRKRHDTGTDAVCCLSDIASSTFADNHPLLEAENMKTSASYTDALEKIFPLAGINRFISLIPCPHPGPLLVLLIVRPSRGQ